MSIFIGDRSLRFGPGAYLNAVTIYSADQAQRFAKAVHDAAAEAVGSDRMVWVATAAWWASVAEAPRSTP